MSNTPIFGRAGILLSKMAAVCLIAFAMAPSGWAQTPPLHLVSTAWPPFTNPPGEPQFALDLVNEALKRIGVAADTSIVDEAEFTKSLLSEKFDGSAAAWKDAERERVLVFSEPYLENRLLLVGRRGSDVSATKLSDLAGKRIVLVGGYSYGDEVASGAGPIFVSSRSEEDSLAKLLANEADYTLMDELVVQYIMSYHGEQARDRLQVGSTPLITRPLHLAIRRARPGAETIVKRFNAEVRKMIADHTYHRLLHVDWIRADVDGDGREELVSCTDHAGPARPEKSYALLTCLPAPAGTPPANDRFYFGGNVYDDWASVPERYKTPSPDAPEPPPPTGNIFRFAW